MAGPPAEAIISFVAAAGQARGHRCIRTRTDASESVVPNSKFAMSLADLDLFDTFRWLLAIICTVYALIVTWYWFSGYVNWFTSSHHLKRIGSYAAILLLRIRVRRFALELVQ